MCASPVGTAERNGNGRKIGGKPVLIKDGRVLLDPVSASEKTRSVV